MGGESLIDEKLGGRLFNDGSWLGFEENDLTTTIDLGEVKPIERVMVGAMQNADSWIFFPEYVEVSWSADGKSYSKPVRIAVEALRDAGRKTVKRVTMEEENIYGRFVKVKVKNIEKCPKWHTAAGQKAWLFVDEITIQ